VSAWKHTARPSWAKDQETGDEHDAAARRWGRPWGESPRTGGPGHTSWPGWAQDQEKRRERGSERRETKTTPRETPTGSLDTARRGERGNGDGGTRDPPKRTRNAPARRGAIVSSLIVVMGEFTVSRSRHEDSRTSSELLIGQPPTGRLISPNSWRRAQRERGRCRR